jgi:hypothetical protein
MELKFIREGVSQIFTMKMMVMEMMMVVGIVMEMVVVVPVIPATGKAEASE